MQNTLISPLLSYGLQRGECFAPTPDAFRRGDLSMFYEQNSLKPFVATASYEEYHMRSNMARRAVPSGNVSRKAIPSHA